MPDDGRLDLGRGRDGASASGTRGSRRHGHGQPTWLQYLKVFNLDLALGRRELWRSMGRRG